VRPLRFLPEAQAELLHEVSYHSQVRAGSGSAFQAAVEATLRHVLMHPLGAPASQGQTRRMRISGFPFSVVYRVSDAEILIVAVAHHRRQPGALDPPRRVIPG